MSITESGPVASAPLGRRTEEEIHSQPDLWRRALELAASGVAGMPEPGERVLVLGCGTSFYVGVAYALLRERAGQGVTEALIASEIPAVFRPYDRVIAISRSGTSSELVDAVKALVAQQPGIRVTVVLGELDTPMEALATDIVDLSWADEESVVQTRFPTTQLVLYRALIDGVDAVEDLPARGDEALAGTIPAVPVRQLVLLAHGVGVPVAEEAALKVRESASAWTESYPVGEYRHGPVATCAPGTLVWGFGRLPDDIVELVERAGGTVEHGGDDPVIELVRLHRFALELARHGGRDPDRPALLSRSVILF